MNVSLDSAAKPVIRSGFRLQWEVAQNAHVLLYPEGMVKLNSSAGEILRRCDGERTLKEIIEDLQRTYGAIDLSNDVNAFVSWALAKQWLEMRA